MSICTAFGVKNLKFSLRIFRFKRFINYLSLMLQFSTLTLSHDKQAWTLNFLIIYNLCIVKYIINSTLKIRSTKLPCILFKIQIC